MSLPGYWFLVLKKPCPLLVGVAPPVASMPRYWSSWTRICPPTCELLMQDLTIFQTAVDRRPVKRSGALGMGALKFPGGVRKAMPASLSRCCRECHVSHASEEDDCFFRGVHALLGRSVHPLVTCRAESFCQSSTESLWLQTLHMLCLGSYFCLLLYLRVARAWGGVSRRPVLWTLRLHTLQPYETTTTAKSRDSYIASNCVP